MTTEPLDSSETDGATRWLTPGRVMRFVKFGLVGASGVIVNLAVFAYFYRVLLDAAPEHPRFVASTAAALIVSIFTNFVLNDVWTWGDRRKGGRRDWVWRMIKYYISASAAGGVQLLVAWLSFHFVFDYFDWSLELPMMAVETLREAGWSGGATVEPGPEVAQLIGIACGMVINFLASHLWAFQDADVDDEHYDTMDEQ